MDFSKLYKKLPKQIQNSEKFLYYSIQFSKFMRKFSKSKTNETNQFMDFLLKSTNIETTGFLRDVQVLSVEILRIIDNICKKHDLDYILCYGTLLGAVRHKGFIPWDEDLDIIMMRKDYNKLIEVLPDEINRIDYLKNNFGLTLLKNFNENLFEDTAHIYTPLYEDYFFDEPDYKQRFLQLACLKPFVKIDVFPFDFIEENSVNEYNKKYLSQKYYFMTLYQKDDFSFNDELNKINKKLGITLDETPYIGEGVDCTKWDDFGAFKKEWIYPIKNITFEGYSFKSPNNAHELLKLWYGETYMNMPSDILFHDFMGYNLLLFDNDEEELSIAIKDTLKELKYINDNFDEL